MSESDGKTLDESRAEVAACLQFLSNEMGWEYFRIEMLHFDNDEKKRSSEQNARMLKNYLAESGHGIKFLQQHGELKAQLAAKDAVIAGLVGALTDLVDAIEGSGGHTEEGDVFDIRAACAALAHATEKGER